MRKIILALFILIILSGCVQQAPKINIEQENMKLISSDFSPNQQIDPKFTCDGENISPQLSWSDVPEGTKSFALSCVDPDAPSHNFFHWLIINIPANVTEISQAGPIPIGAEQLSNGFGQANYGGPCPPSSSHHYIFKIYALDIAKLNDVNKDNFLTKVSEHALDSAELVGFYGR